jgi:RNA polymerase sigma-70 factor (ECF subfamily)
MRNRHCIPHFRRGDFQGLVAVLDPDVLFRVDEAAARPGAPREIRGARKWAKGAIAFSQVAQKVQLMLVNGAVGFIWAARGKLLRALCFTLPALPQLRWLPSQHDFATSSCECSASERSIGNHHP